MAGIGPRVLVVADSWDERAAIRSTLREAGFAAVAVADNSTAMAALRREPFAAAVIALAPEVGIDLLRRARHQQTGLPALLVVDPAAPRLVDEDCATVVKRPIDPRQLLGCVFELVLRPDDGPDSRPRLSQAAELGIAAARLACLCNRRASAAAAGAGRLAQDLAHQIGEMRATYRDLAAAVPTGRSAANACC